MNKSKTYILPLLAQYIPLNYTFMKFLWDTYLFIEDEDEKDSPPAVLYLEVASQFQDLSEYRTIHNSFLINKQFIKYFEQTTFNIAYIYYVFRIPNSFLQDYYLLRKGHYSQISVPAKDAIRSYLYKFYPHKQKSIENIWKILTKDVSLKIELENQLATILPEDVELAEKFNLKNETLIL